ncbi:hypothetical protein UCRPC4_g02976 [Phaeomoniella chlamydospora]|uniref:Uncharacterized protein n=1 Tax=Phaeomoniella chlamydospora TaxID=158046 RepID=A0A0G2EM10_PHACM|nr:hypothetical protein UCRPC4_g02976 [Phaeomoniella chlamydospora]
MSVTEISVAPPSPEEPHHHHHNHQYIADAFKKALLDPIRRVHASVKLHHLKQMDEQPFSEYYALHRHYLTALFNSQKLGDKERKDWLRLILNQKLRDSLFMFEEPQRYHDFVKLLIKLDYKNYLDEPNPGTPDVLDPSSAPTSPLPLDKSTFDELIESHMRPRLPIAFEERQRRVGHEKCLLCGRLGHLTTSCVI